MGDWCPFKVGARVMLIQRQQILQEREESCTMGNRGNVGPRVGSKGRQKDNDQVHTHKAHQWRLLQQHSREIQRQCQIGGEIGEENKEDNRTTGRNNT